MPEGPEIRRQADALQHALQGYDTEEVWFAFDHLKPYEEQLGGQIVTAVESWGKAILIRFGNELNIYSHNQLYGRWLVSDTYDYPETSRQLRLAIHNRRRSAFLYSASTIEVVPSGELVDHYFLSKLGPDLLHASSNQDVIEMQIRSGAFAGRQFAGLLLDQGFLAGIGNYLRSEILFVARLHPRQRPRDCSAEQLRRLSRACLRVTRQSYETGGITNDLELASALRESGAPRSQYRHWVFNRAGEPCYQCSTLIERHDWGGRRIYHCPDCQTETVQVSRG